MPRHPADHIPTDFGGFNLKLDQPIVPQLYGELRKKILALELKPGAGVSEAELAAAAGVSRTPARQVIKQLVTENLLIAFSSRGTYVSKIDTNRLKDALFIRRRLEPELARRCALDPGHDQIAAGLRGILQTHENALSNGLVDQAYAMDSQFHQAICVKDGDGLLWQIIRQARTEADRLHTLSSDRANSLHNALNQHRLIVEAINAGDPELSYQAMDRHLRSNEDAFDVILVGHPELFSAPKGQSG